MLGSASTKRGPGRSAEIPPEDAARHEEGSHEGSPAGRSRTEERLRDALAFKDAQLRQKDELIQQQDLLSKESDHRLLNDLQIIVSLLSLQSRETANPEAAAQLAIAAKRVASIERLHRRLHFLDGAQSVTFKRYIEDLCRDFSTMLSTGESSRRDIAVEGIDIEVPTAIGIPLGFVVNELITNAAKHGDGRITIRLAPGPATGYALSVCNEGPPLPEGFDPAARKGLGMKIIRSFVKRIGGELQIGRCDDGRGARFTVLFSVPRP